MKEARESRWTIHRLLFGRDAAAESAREDRESGPAVSYVDELRPEDGERPELSVRTPIVRVA